MENHRVEILDRKRITISQVADVDAFDEHVLWANLKEGSVELTGQGLHIEKLDLEEGILTVSGQMDSLTYSSKGTGIKKGLFERLAGK